MCIYLVDLVKCYEIFVPLRQTLLQQLCKGIRRHQSPDASTLLSILHKSMQATVQQVDTFETVKNNVYNMLGELAQDFTDTQLNVLFRKFEACFPCKWSTLLSGAVVAQMLFW